MDPSLEILLADADVLIDYRDSDLSIFTLVSKHIGPPRVLGEVLNEAPGISERQCGRLGIEVAQLETELMLTVNVLPRETPGDLSRRYRPREFSAPAGGEATHR